MVSQRGCAWLVAALVLVASVAVAAAQDIPIIGSLAASGARLAELTEPDSGWYASRGVQKFINSFCSYEFSDATGQDPFSRSEFPIDQWFIGGQSSRAWSTLTFSVDGWSLLNRESALKFQKSQWTFPADPDQKTVISESNCRMLEAYLVDISVDWAMVPGARTGLRPVGGFRWHTFRFLTYDGYRGSIDPQAPSGPLPGDGIDGRFTFRDWWYVGVRSSFNRGPVRCRVHGDYGWLRADMADRNLLQGDMRAELHGSGHAWRLSAGLALMAHESLTVRVDGDFTRISVIDTTVQQWDASGVLLGGRDKGRIWSDRQSVAVSAELRF
ncbi:MAG: omptin family outer membrane protease [Desulfomonile tiedjei]|nr:omptin family outer membrane protease [Desulfomonile tiedjei]